uniref:UGP3-like C-terminal hexapeptide repeats domain-containing protein n=1 Tax=Dunaliella tertiolecta TaxID=3047 RepID=A0A7S3QX17_DUNTE
MQHARPPAASISQQASSSSMSLSASPAAAKWKACTRRRCHTQSAPIQNSTNSLGSRGGVQSRSVCAPLQVANVQVAESRGSVREGHRGLGKEGKQAHLPVLFPPPSHQPSCPAHSPVVLQPPQPLHAQLLHLNALKADLSRCNSLSEKVNLLGSKPGVRAFLRANSAKPVLKCLPRLRLHEQYVLLCLPAMGQEHVLIQPSGTATARGGTSSVMAPLAELAALLMRVDQFYDSIGGLVGYQAKSIELILEGTGEQQPQQAQEEVSYHVPHALDLAGEGGREVGEQVAMQGLLALPDMAEIYPVGGAGDRLGLECEATGECLPAAMLPYGGRTMMEGLIRDLQAREHLYFRLTGKQVTTPVAIMTSDAKGNHRRMLELMESVDWFGRGKDSFRLFRQPLVPVISVEDGQWLLSDAMQLMAKPGGHGAIWKLMRDEGVFAWLQQQGRKAALVRQISNPMAGTDTTLLALAGRGQQQRSSFGFMSCDRAVGASEGCNALQERKRWEGGAWKYEYGYTNIEYTEFGRLGMSDQPTEHNSTTSKFPANTNVLYVNLDDALRVVEQAVTVGSSEQLMPGLIFNRNKAINYKDPLRGTPAQRMLAGRMECTMQNIADYMTDRKSEALQPTDPACNQLSTFLVYNERRKVTSSAKKRREQGSTKISQTPDGSFYDLQRNAWHLLQQCGVAAPPIVSVEQYLQNGPGFLFLFNPALGPLWDVVSQKIRGGELKPGAELVLEVAEASLEGVTVDGSLLVYADHALGHREATPASPTHASTAAALHRPWRHHSSSSSSSSKSRHSKQ